MMDLETAMPLELIREHTKTDDELRVSDSLLKLYRKAALEAAEKWTGQKFTGMKQITETLPAYNPTSLRQSFLIKLKRPVADNYVLLRGGALAQPQRLVCAPGTRKIAVPSMFFSAALFCCAPCGQDSDNALKVSYRTGEECGDNIPAGIIMGCLKYIAWQVGNPGDVLVKTMDSTAKMQGSGTNNAVTASGAAEEWRIYRI